MEAVVKSRSSTTMIIKLSTAKSVLEIHCCFGYEKSSIYYKVLIFLEIFGFCLFSTEISAFFMTSVKYANLGLNMVIFHQNFKIFLNFLFSP